MVKHREAESELLYPKLLELDPGLEAETKSLLRDYDEIAEQPHFATRCIYKKDEDSSLAFLGRLIDITSGHWLSQVQTLYAAADALNEQLLKQVADKLSEAVDIPIPNSAQHPYSDPETCDADRSRQS